MNDYELRHNEDWKDMINRKELLIEFLRDKHRQRVGVLVALKNAEHGFTVGYTKQHKKLDEWSRNFSVNLAIERAKVNRPRKLWSEEENPLHIAEDRRKAAFNAVRKKKGSYTVSEYDNLHGLCPDYLPFLVEEHMSEFMETAARIFRNRQDREEAELAKAIE